jgi:hypothetical protein
VAEYGGGALTGAPGGGLRVGVVVKNGLVVSLLRLAADARLLDADADADAEFDALLDRFEENLFMKDIAACGPREILPDDADD